MQQQDDTTDGPRHQSSVARREHDVVVQTEDFPAAPAAREDVDIPLTQKMLSAVSGSIFTSLLVTPLDVVRVRLQSQQPPSPSSLNFRNTPNASLPPQFSNLPPNLGVSSCCREVFWVNNNAQFCVVGGPLNAGTIDSTAGECVVEETSRKTYTSTLDGLRKIARNEGLTTLWRGLSPTLVMAVPGNVIYFAGYDWLRSSRLSPLKDRVSDAYSPLIAGSVARIIAAFFVSPIELFRTRMQAANSSTATGTYRETLGGVKDMIHAQGYTALWRGLTLTLWRDVPFSALYWWGYEATRNILSDSRDRARGRAPESGASLTRNRSSSRANMNHTSTLIDSFAAGALSGAVASVVTTPFDVGKTRQQVFHHSSTASAETIDGALRPEQRSMMRFLWHIFQEEGAAGLFKGWAPRVLKVAPACAIMISSYELGKKMNWRAKTDAE